MIENRTIFYFSNIYFSETWFSKQALAMELAKHNKVFFINAPVHMFSKRLASSTVKMAGKMYKPSKNLVVFTPRIGLPWFKYNFSNRPFCEAIKHSFEKAVLERFNIKGKPIVFYNSPIYLNLLGEFNEEKNIWHLTDDYQSLKEYQNRTYRSLDEEFTSKVDLILAVSNKLAEDKKKENRNTYLFLNAMDWDWFNSQKKGIPDDLKAIKGKKVGFVGSINSRIDTILMMKLSEKLDKLSFIFIGAKGARDFDLREYRQLFGQRNIWEFGARERNKIPSYLENFDVLILPYKVNEFNEASDPLKLYEYLASGKPIVTTNLQSARKFSKAIYVARDDEDFIKLLDVALTDKSEEMKNLRINTAKANTWEVRVKELERILSS